MPITIDGPNKVISLDATTFAYSAEEIYSRWKDWVLLSDNAKFLEAFRIVGGDDLGGGAKAPAFIFLRNDYGWRLKKPEATIDVTINGNLLPEDSNTALTSEPVGAFNPTITFNRQNVTQIDTGSLAASVWSYALEGTETAAEMMRIMRSAVAGVSTISGTVYRFFSRDGSKIRIDGNVTTNGVRTSVTTDGSE